MTKVVFIEHDGTEHEVDAENGTNLMEAATKHLVPGIDADCGGACACATCMIYVPEEWAAKLPEKEDMEETMLDFCDHSKENSRLACQIEVTDALEGIRVSMPASQH
ncbi:ferredoxin [Tepidicaulis marinus]|jgi:2Fe-2S ferredoxin|uniref:Ferredoxin n=1 Tax=Tepidicaulis marinus TaxID=1333998 RepID=A0A081BE41_9HYPH|nr:2Fe-2S iron-sulfur cluster-binding protein [Tepidicaulis marinus]GAK46309.1 ferredoxin [Tepidicaulis marinus]